MYRHEIHEVNRILTSKEFLKTTFNDILPSLIPYPLELLEIFSFHPFLENIYIYI